MLFLKYHKAQSSLFMLLSCYFKCFYASQLYQSMTFVYFLFWVRWSCSCTNIMTAHVFLSAWLMANFLFVWALDTTDRTKEERCSLRENLLFTMASNNWILEPISKAAERRNCCFGLKEGANIVGKSKRCCIPIPSILCSTKHCTITLRSDQVFLKDEVRTHKYYICLVLDSWLFVLIVLILCLLMEFSLSS